MKAPINKLYPSVFEMIFDVEKLVKEGFKINEQDIPRAHGWMFSVTYDVPEPKAEAPKEPKETEVAKPAKASTGKGK